MLGVLFWGEDAKAKNKLMFIFVLENSPQKNDLSITITLYYRGVIHHLVNSELGGCFAHETLKETGKCTQSLQRLKVNSG